jgi:CheY-like chemotaxis protein
MGKVILIVEDDPKNMTLTSDMLKVSGYTTIKANDGEQGVILARKNKPDLILMDLMMPKKDGYTACHEIKSDPATKNIPVVMLTAIENEGNKGIARIWGADGYITKPLDRQGLVNTISPLLATRGVR